jgi:hypothetical protein
LAIVIKRVFPCSEAVFVQKLDRGIRAATQAARTLSFALDLHAASSFSDDRYRLRLRHRQQVRRLSQWGRVRRLG